MSIRDIDITGSSTLTTSTASSLSNWTYDAPTIDSTINLLSVGPQMSKTTITRDMSAGITAVDEYGERGGCAMRYQSGKGMVTSYGPLIGNVDWQMDENYSQLDLVLRYECTETSLGLTGFVGGVVQLGWVYAFDRPS